MSAQAEPVADAANAPHTHVGRFLRRHPLGGGLALACILFVAVLMLTEGAAWLLILLRGTAGPERFRQEIPIVWDESNARLGFRPTTTDSGRMRKTNGDEVAYDFHYSIDTFHRRVTPISPPAKRDRFAIFFGGSYTFGEGVEDDQTLPACFGRLAPAYQPYNYGYRAYGLQHAYLNLTRPGFPNEIAQDNGVLFYLFIDHHIDRLIGRMRVVGNWGEDLPCLTLGPQGWNHHGGFRQAWPIRRKVYTALCHSAMLKLLKVDWPPRIRPQDYALTARMMQSIFQAAHKIYPNSPFYVIFHPTSKHAAVLAPMLDELGVRYLNYSGSYDSDPPETGKSYFLADGHPTVLAHQWMAQHIVADLGLAGSQ